MIAGALRTVRVRSPGKAIARAMIAAGALLLPVVATGASAQSCAEAWYQRNVLYKNAGYCFRTKRGIDAFGNACCQYDRVEDVPLSRTDRAAIGDIAEFERRHGCPR